MATLLGLSIRINVNVKKMRQAIVSLFKISSSVGLVTLVLRQIDFQAVADILRTISVPVLALAFSASLVQAIALAWRWHRVIRRLGERLLFSTAVRLTFVGLFFNQVLPSSIGGDALRILGAYRSGLKSELAWSSVAIERITGLASLALLVTVSLSQVWWELRPGSIRWALFASAPLAFSGLIVLSFSDKFPISWLPTSVRSHLREFAQGLRLILGRFGASLEIFSLGCLSSSLGILSAYIIGLEIGITLDFPAYLCVLGGAVILTVIPISLAGWGLREAAVVGLFGEMGVSSEKALVVSLLFGLGLTVSSLPGGILWALKGRIGDERRQPAVSAAGGARHRRGTKRGQRR